MFDIKCWIQINSY